MECGRFRELRPTHGKGLLPREVWETREHAAWTEHFHECETCSDWELGCRVVDRGFDPARSGEYGMPIRDGGSASSLISYGPWCGAALTTRP
jgi:hypothetical protein